MDTEISQIEFNSYIEGICTRAVERIALNTTLDEDHVKRAILDMSMKNAGIQTPFAIARDVYIALIEDSKNLYLPVVLLNFYATLFSAACF